MEQIEPEQATRLIGVSAFHTPARIRLTESLQLAGGPQEAPRHIVASYCQHCPTWSGYRCKRLFWGEIMALRPDDFLIGELSTRSGVSVETLRYYERVGLMPPPPRTAGGRRVYDIRHLKRAIFVRRARSLGFSLDQIRDLLGFSPNGDLSCAEVKALTEMHIAVIGRKVTELRKLEQILSDLVAACGGRARSGCPVLEALGEMQRSCADQHTSARRP